MIKDTPRTELVNTFGQIVGVEKAERLLDEAARELDLAGRDVYATEDVIDLCELIEAREEGYVSMLAEDLKIEKQSERRFNTLLENIPDPTVVVSFAGEDPVIKTVNTAFESAFGSPLEAVKGEPLPAVVLSEEVGAAEDCLDPSRLAMERVEREVHRETADGEIRNFLVRSMPVSTMAGEVEAVIIHTDITEQKRREHELERQNERLESFASVISHDLRNPMTVATGRLPLIREQIEGDPEHVDAVAEALDRMDEMIEDLLTLAKQGRAVGDPESVAVSEPAERAWANVASGSATLEFDADVDTVSADPARLQEAFENLFRNAIEHAGEDVTVRIGRNPDGFYVSDDGPGIPAADRDEVFDRGFTTREDGTGFGLSIVRTIMEAHGWEITAEESESGGARFDVVVPAIQGRAGVAGPAVSD